ncbi:DUF6177 family protein [Streptantibioticus rubrisoli]|uniref:DUF6177 family protein n=1 Tax=Streptantibioticus rubrisoli TaxID=1387313 RepID=A0ABT1PMG0_9ACTN|nr:DUF6177 family protein [Streptantibioticus rubrisoli]MCQ4045991.1 DUF6177 family protein [Streptantibioticus rubrisoli]
MTKDAIALTPRMPDVRTIASALLAAGPELRLQSLAGGAVIQLCDAAGRPLLSVEAPVLLDVPGETRRLLGPQADARTPLWWTEARASTAVPGGERLAATFAGQLARRLDGSTWPPEAADVPDTPVEATATVAPAPAAAQPAVDVLTDRVAVVIQERPVIAMTTWLSDALRACVGSNRALQIVSPADCRLSLPTRLALSGAPHRWVIRDDAGGYHDGLSGAQLHWRDGAFRPVDGAAPAESFLRAETSDERQLLLSFRTCHPAEEQLVLGGALETAWRALTGGPPAGWGTAEPVGSPWSRQEITALARDRAPEGTWLVAVGDQHRPVLATMRVARTPDGVEEDISLALGGTAGDLPSADQLRALAGELAARYGLRNLLVQRRAARGDLTVPARFEALPVPLAFAVGPMDVDEIGVERARRPPLGPAPHTLGAAAAPGFYYELGDGTSAGGWAHLEQLMRHLRGPAGDPP